MTLKTGMYCCWKCSAMFHSYHEWCAHKSNCQDSATLVPRTTAEFLVRIAVRYEEITRSRGAEILGMPLDEFLEWWSK